MTTEQARRSIAERVIARARARGTPIDNDPEYMAIVELWIAGEIGTEEMRQRYIALLQQRSRTRHARPERHLPATMIKDERLEALTAVDEVERFSNEKEI
ncbi:hypothetical protein [Rhizobium sp. RCC_161_2]|uniref:hypothetical protein n=1 Tax=Rhizobium sp. RCC_161_2 TaxID=3239219 RepID=UPI0035244EA3